MAQSVPVLYCPKCGDGRTLLSAATMANFFAETTDGREGKKMDESVKCNQPGCHHRNLCLEQSGVTIARRVTWRTVADLGKAYL